MARPIGPGDVGELVAKLRREWEVERRGPDVREKPTFVQWAGFWLLWAVLGLIALLLAGLLVYLMISTPPVSAFGSPVTAESLALYEKASNLVFQRVTALVDQVVVRILLPVLTLLLGYVFGARAGQSSSPEEEGR